MPLGENFSESEILEERQLFAKTLPKGLLKLLELSPKGLAVDYSNNFSAVVVNAQSFIGDAESFEYLLGSIQRMPFYGEYLRKKVGQYNDRIPESEQQLDEKMLVEKLSEAPDVVRIDVVVAAMKQLKIEHGPHILDQLKKLKDLIDEGMNLLTEGSAYAKLRSAGLG